jgi:hypothetical protein
LPKSIHQLVEAALESLIGFALFIDAPVVVPLHSASFGLMQMDPCRRWSQTGTAGEAAL